MICEFYLSEAVKKIWAHTAIDTIAYIMFKIGFQPPSSKLKHEIQQYFLSQGPKVSFPFGLLQPALE